MGYYTYFRVEANTESSQLLQDIEEWCEHNRPEILRCTGGIRGGWADENHKWYDYQDDMLAVSTQFPDVEFGLVGDGEENLDRWEKVFKGGKITFQVHAETTMERYPMLIKHLKENLNALPASTRNILQGWGELDAT